MVQIEPRAPQLQDLAPECAQEGWAPRVGERLREADAVRAQEPDRRLRRRGLYDVHEPVFYGPDAATAYDFVLGLRDTRQQLAALQPVMRGPARDRLRAMLAVHETESGVLFDAGTWIISAQARPAGSACRT